MKDYGNAELIKVFPYDNSNNVVVEVVQAKLNIRTNLDSKYSAWYFPKKFYQMPKLVTI